LPRKFVAEIPGERDPPAHFGDNLGRVLVLQTDRPIDVSFRKAKIGEPLVNPGKLALLSREIGAALPDLADAVHENPALYALVFVLDFGRHAPFLLWW
jgi:hypothetical protein